MKDARRQKRKQPVLYLEVYGRVTGEFIGNVVDITTGGIRLYGEKILKPGVIYPMRLVLPQPVKGAGEIEFDGKCRWCKEYRQHTLAGSYGVGLEFRNIPPRSVEIIEQMMASSWFRDWRQLPDYEAIRNETGFPGI